MMVHFVSEEMDWGVVKNGLKSSERRIDKL